MTIASYIDASFATLTDHGARVTRGCAADRGASSSPVLRNLEITHAYSLLAAEVAARGGQGANWCMFATWASRQAGATIRGEDAIDFLQDRLCAAAALLHPLAVVRALAAAARAVRPRVAARAADGPPAHAVRRRRAGQRRRRARQPQGLRGDRLRVRALPRAPRPRRVPRRPARRRPAGRPAAAARRLHPLRAPAPDAAGAAAARTSRSACTSRPACSPRSARRSTRPTSPRRSSAGACARPPPAHPARRRRARRARPRARSPSSRARSSPTR